MPQRKETITIRLDADLLEWLRKAKKVPDANQRRIANLHGSDGYAIRLGPLSQPQVAMVSHPLDVWRTK